MADLENLFADVNFIIFPNIRRTETSALRKLIRKHGGYFIDYSHLDFKDDRAELDGVEGIALIDPSELYAPKLFEKRQRSGGALKYINWGYPQYCVSQRSEMDVDDSRESLALCQMPTADGGYPCFLSPTLRFSETKQQRYMDRIENHGGKMVFREKDAIISVVPNDNNIMKEERERLQFTNTRPESVEWLNMTMFERRYVKFTPPILRPMPGRRPYSDPAAIRRTEFTKEDDMLLIKYLAQQGDKRGRQGNVLYQRFVELHPEAKQRHPWISWQNRYKKAIKHFNKQIDHYGEWYPQVHLDGYSQDPRSDAMNRNSRTRVSAVGRRRAANVDHDTDEEAGPPVQNNRAALVQTRIRPHRGRQVPETESEDDEPQEVSPPPPPTQNEFEAANQHDYESLGEDNGQYDPSETSEDAQGIVDTHEFENGIPGNSTSTPPRIVEQTSPLSTQATVVNFREQILKAASQIKAPQYDVFPSDEENEEGGILLQKRPVYHTELPHIDMNDHRHKKARRSNARPLPDTQITLIHDEENHTPARSFRFDGTSRRKATPDKSHRAIRSAAAGIFPTKSPAKRRRFS